MESITTIYFILSKMDLVVKKSICQSEDTNGSQLWPTSMISERKAYLYILGGIILDKYNSSKIYLINYKTVFPIQYKPK
jgi:hypothetical protein